MQEHIIENTYYRIRELIFEELKKGYKNPSSKEIMDGTSIGRSYFEKKVLSQVIDLCYELVEDWNGTN